MAAKINACKKMAGSDVCKLINTPLEPDGSVNKSPGESKTNNKKLRTNSPQLWWCCSCIFYSKQTLLHCFIN